jgi:hypothetical protein
VLWRPVRTVQTFPGHVRTMAPHLQAGRKRGREQLEELEVDLADGGRKRARLGWPAQQWITVYNKHVPMKQRCAFAAARLSTDAWAGLSEPPCAPPQPPPLVQEGGGGGFDRLPRSFKFLEPTTYPAQSRTSCPVVHAK